MSANPSMLIRIAANLSELRANLKEGKDSIEVTTQAMHKLASSLEGSKLEQNAHNIVAAVNQIGGAAKLTEAEQARVNRTLEAFIEKAELMGKTAPKAMLDLAAATKAVPVDQLAADTERLVQKLTGGAIPSANLYAAAIEKIGGVSKLTSVEQAQVNSIMAGAIEKYRALGQQAPPAIIALADATSGLKKETAELGGQTTITEKEMRAHLGTEKEVEKTTGSLTDTVKSLVAGFAAMFTARAAYNFVNQTVAEASALSDLSAQTRINVEELQILGAAVSEFGVDSNELGKALFEVSRKIAGGDESVVRGLHMMSLSLKAVEGLKGEELFLKIENGLATLQGSLRDTAASEIFGSKLGMAMAGASEGINDAMARAREMNTVMSKESVQALDEHGKAIERLETSLKNRFVNTVMGPVATGLNEYIELVQKAGFWSTTAARFIDGFLGGEMAFEQLKRQIEGATGASGTWELSANAAAAASRAHAAALTEQGQAAQFMASLERDAAASIEPWRVKALEHLKQIGQLNAGNAAAIGVNAVQFAKYNAETERSAAASQQLAAALDEMKSTGDGWKGTLAEIDPILVGQVRTYLEAGVAQGALATAYGLTATQVAAVAKKLKEEDEVLKVTQKSILETVKLWDDYNYMVAEQGGTAIDAQMAKIEQWRADEISKLKESDENWAAHFELINQNADKMRAGVMTDWNAIGENSKEHLQQIADKARNTYEYMVAHSERFSTETIGKFWKLSEEAQLSADNWGQAFTDNFSRAAQAAADTAAKVSGATQVMLGQLRNVASFQNPFALSGSMSQEEMAARAKELGGSVAYDSFNNPYVYVAGKNAPPGGPRADGGPVRTGVEYLVGERGPERFIAPANGQIIPNGGGGGVTVTISPGAFVFHNTIANDPRSLRELGDLMGTALIQKLRGAGVPLPAGV